MKTLGAQTIMVAGASGTIGRAVARAAIADGHTVVCLLRDSEAGRDAVREIDTLGGAVCWGDLDDPASLIAAFADHPSSVVISCIASRSGSPKDARAVDYQANANLLAAAIASGAEHFILLSAICVQRPLLAFQHAKLAFEAELRASAIEHTIVRPTAFFKSLSGQVERVRKGKPFLIFGDGELTRCKPISDRDLARFIADCVTVSDRRGKVLPIGGPGPAITLKEQGELLFDVAGKETRFKSISPRLFTAAGQLLSIGAPISDWLAEKAEYARIAHYYATESMLVLDPETGKYSADATPEFGSDTLRYHYAALLETR